MKKIIALTGATGNMGTDTLAALHDIKDVHKIKILVLSEEKRKGKRLSKKYDKVEVIYGNLADIDTCRKLVDKADYVLNLAAVIPPKSDKFPLLAEECNWKGVKALVDAICEIQENQPKFIHISTVALYGNRNHLHPWGRVGDPLLPSPYDAYAITKLRGERYVLESHIKTWAILRQTAMMHPKMLAGNISDGLMFHTCYNAFLEWVTSKDSGILMANIIKQDIDSDLGDKFWKKCFNISGGDGNRLIGYDTFNDGFGLIGGTTKSFMKPNWCATRNFHGLWFYDGDKLEDLFHYHNETAYDYWQGILATHRYYALAKILPPSLISKLVVQRLLRNYNAPAYWRKHNDLGKIHAYFGSVEAYDNLTDDWNKFYLIKYDNKLPDGAPANYDDLLRKEKATLLSHGYDETKADSELDIEDMRSAATFRGGKLISETMTKGDLYTPLEWECAHGHRFYATPYTVLKAGHWCDECIDGYTWDFYRLSKANPFYAQVWFDTHSEEEDIKYYFDKDFNAKYDIRRGTL